MKKYPYLLIVLSLFSSGFLTHVSGKAFFGSVAGNYIFPGEDEWDSAIGGELRLGININENVRFFGLLNFSRWDLDSGASGNTGSGRYVVSGDADVYSVGGGAELLIPLSYKLTASVSGSVQKQFVDSDVRYSITNDQGQEIGSGSAEIKDGVSAYAGVDLLYVLSDTVDLFVGGGYLFSLEDPEVTQLIGPGLFTTKFEGFTVRAGISF